MTIDQKKIREIARVCATLSKSAPTAEEHEIFANLALKWLTIALDRETQVANAALPSYFAVSKSHLPKASDPDPAKFVSAITAENTVAASPSLQPHRATPRKPA